MIQTQSEPVVAVIVW